MADETNESEDMNSSKEQQEGDHGVTRENNKHKALLHSFFISAVKSIYNMENEGGELNDSDETGDRCNEKKGD
ncbi:hypothetical protein WH221_03315 [Chryseobacterium culicis]|uniref:Uncharacterized protein n=1 Tax=Chryseobacterium culicis TaxID=680127 RepID=A0A2S9CXW9_CHRCI|nr:hypothetical protein [Chryseobacterium culicis]PRB85296.1 hypothetical protein CQ022_03265 [Chryseobacterium culicis]PRB90984.1 hypothetical protein CQ033_09725 [Chryseobacterium culicis]